MKKYLQFNDFIMIDRMSLPISAGEYKVWSPKNRLLEKGGLVLTQQIESKIIKWLIELKEVRLLILKNLDLKETSFYALEVKQPVIEDSNKKPGDIDILFCENPDESVAIQVKCVRVESYTNEEDYDIKKLPNIKDVVLQTNKQCSNLAFHRNFMLIVVLTDGNARTQLNLNDGIENIFRSKATDHSLQQIYDYQQNLSLDEDAGVIYIEIIQPTSISFEKQCIVRICIDKKANKLEQKENLTNRIRDFIRQKSCQK